jgi:hypothetical protein
MQIGSNNSYDTSTSYTIKLNERQMLVVEEDPLSKSRNDAKKSVHLKEIEDKKAQDKAKSSNPKELSEDEKRLVKDLQSRDSEVKAHESAHQAAGGGMTGAASFTYQQGPDGKMYAIGGEVSISTPSSSSPEEAIKNARTLAAAAMAAGDPSPQDFSVAASARVMEMKAQQQLARETQEKLNGQETYKNATNAQDKEKPQKLLLDIPA